MQVDVRELFEGEEGASAPSVDEIKSRFCAPAPEDASGEQLAYQALYFAVCEHAKTMRPLEELDEPPRVAFGKRKASAEMVSRLTAEARRLLRKNSDEAAEALRSASVSVDAAELAESGVESGATDESGAGDATGGKSAVGYQSLQDLVDPSGAGAALGAVQAGGADMSDSAVTARFAVELPSPQLQARCQEYIQRLGSQNESEVQRVRRSFAFQLMHFCSSWA